MTERFEWDELERHNVIGRTHTGRVLFVVYIEDEAIDLIRIISARDAERHERNRYDTQL